MTVGKDQNRRKNTDSRYFFCPTQWKPTVLFIYFCYSKKFNLTVSDLKYKVSCWDSAFAVFNCIAIVLIKKMSYFCECLYNGTWTLRALSLWLKCHGYDAHSLLFPYLKQCFADHIIIRLQTNCWAVLFQFLKYFNIHITKQENV